MDIDHKMIIILTIIFSPVGRQGTHVLSFRTVLVCTCPLLSRVNHSHCIFSPYMGQAGYFKHQFYYPIMLMVREITCEEPIKRCESVSIS